MKTFGDFLTKYCRTIYLFYSARIDVPLDRYDVPSPKDDTHIARSAQSATKKGKKKQNNKFVLKAFSEDKDFKVFLTVKENKIAQQLGEVLIEQVPTNKQIVVTCAFADPLAHWIPCGKQARG